MINMDKILAAKKAAHPERIARDGALCFSKAAAEWRNELLSWHDRGKPEHELADLQARKPVQPR